MIDGLLAALILVGQITPDEAYRITRDRKFMDGFAYAGPVVLAADFKAALERVRTPEGTTDDGTV